MKISWIGIRQSRINNRMSRDWNRTGKGRWKAGLISPITLLFLLLIIFPLAAQSPTAAEILEKIDRNYRADTYISTSTMIVRDRRESRTIKAKSYARGRDETFTEYLYPPREQGTKMLKLHDNLWMYSPSSDRIIQISGHMLRQSVMGSDLSYEDFMENDLLSEDYEAQITGEQIQNDRSCWILKLIARKSDVTYHSRNIWVDKERFLPLKEERYAKGGKLLKTLDIQDVFKVGERWYPKKMIFKDALKKGDGTALILDSIDFNAAIPEHLLSKAALKK